MTVGGYVLVGFESLLHTNDPLSTRRKKSRRKVQKRMIIIANGARTSSLWFAAIHLNYLKACDEWVAQKIVLCLSSL